tara:strand:- start:217 stop:375 length:159 start_codon:yes stop_codon:yes gene_type:complete
MNKAERKAKRRRERVEEQGRIVTVNNRAQIKSKYAAKKTDGIKKRLEAAFRS